MPPTQDEVARSDETLPLQPGDDAQTAATSAFESPAARSVPTSHPIGFWFFFWGELAERCSYYGMRAILALYMARKLGFEESTADMAMHAFIAACYLLTVPGGWIAATVLGEYRTIVSCSILYILG